MVVYQRHFSEQSDPVHLTLECLFEYLRVLLDELPLPSVFYKIFLLKMGLILS